MGDVLRFPTRLPPSMVSPVVPAGYCDIPDPFLELMKRNGIPLTRENYINLATLGGNPDTVEWTGNTTRTCRPSCATTADTCRAGPERARDLLNWLYGSGLNSREKRDEIPPTHSITSCDPLGSALYSSM
jgi:hypothetical protein